MASQPFSASPQTSHSSTDSNKLRSCARKPWLSSTMKMRAKLHCPSGGDMSSVKQSLAVEYTVKPVNFLGSYTDCFARLTGTCLRSLSYLLTPPLHQKMTLGRTLLFPTLPGGQNAYQSSAS